MATVYEILGIKPQDDFAVLRKAYLSKAKAVHPDKNKESNEKEFKDLQTAWTLINDEKKAKLYFSWFQNFREKPDFTMGGPENAVGSQTQKAAYSQTQLQDAMSWWTFCATKFYANPGNIQTEYRYQHATGFHRGALNLWSMIERQVSKHKNYVERVLEFKTLYHQQLNKGEGTNYQFSLVNHNTKCDFPDSYYKMEAVSRARHSNEDPLLDVARGLLNDYTKGNSTTRRFFHGHWNRHHVEAVGYIVNAIDNKKINNMEDLILILRCVELKNPTPSGSLFRRINFIENMYFDRLESSKSASAEKDLPSDTVLKV